jgi:hypothetical protein
MTWLGVIGGDIGMRMIGKFAAATLTCVAFLSPNAMAQGRSTEVAQLLGQVLAQADAVPGLADAIAAGDTVAINNIVAANVNNPAVLAQIAATLLAAAQTLGTTAPTTAAIFAAIAINTGALVGTNAVIALNIVSSNPTALALLTNPNAPNTGGTFTANTASLVPPSNPANNSAQQCGSCN